MAPPAAEPRPITGRGSWLDDRFSDMTLLNRLQSGVLRPRTGLLGACLVGLMLILATRLQAQPTAAESLPLARVARRLAAHEPVRIVAFGSSSTEGVGASSPAASYPSQLQADLSRLLEERDRVIVLNRGIGGGDADDMALRLPRVIAERPDLIIWQTGSNDPLRGVPLERFVRETSAGIQQIRAANIDVMLMEPQLCRKLDDQHDSDFYRQAVRGIGEAMQLPVIRRYDLMHAWLDEGLGPEQMLSPDGLHMADGGYAKLADAIARDILRRAESPRTATADMPTRYALGHR